MNRLLQFGSLLTTWVGAILFGHYIAAGVAALFGVSVPIMALLWLGLAGVIVALGYGVSRRAE